MKSTRSAQFKRLGLNAAIVLSLLASHNTLANTFDLTEFQNQILSQHNGFRTTHHTQLMTQDSLLASDAQAWAEHLLNTGTFVHDSNSYAGENLFKVVRPLPSEPPMSEALIALYKQYYPNWEPPQPFTGSSLADSSAAAWYNEVQNYSYITNQSTNGNSVGHFTQMVWKASTQLGCGAAWKKVQNNTMVEAVVVCRYLSRGNVVGTYYDNVLQP